MNNCDVKREGLFADGDEEERTSIGPATNDLEASGPARESSRSPPTRSGVG